MKTRGCVTTRRNPLRTRSATPKAASESIVRTSQSR